MIKKSETLKTSAGYLKPHAMLYNSYNYLHHHRMQLLYIPIQQLTLTYSMCERYLALSDKYNLYLMPYHIYPQQSDFWLPDFLYIRQIIQILFCRHRLYSPRYTHD